MEKDFEELVYTQCQRALECNEDYLETQRKCADAYKKNDFITYSDLTGRLQAIAEKECYKRGLADACTHFCTPI
jgi:hypothetical protein